MLTKRTLIGMGIGGLAVVLGSFFLIQSLISNIHEVNEPVDIGKSDVFQFDVQKHYHELLNVTGSSFHVKLTTPSNGLQVDDNFQNQVSFDYVILENGKNFINITNTGGSALHVIGKLSAVQNPLVFTTHLIVITSGILIIGISAAFSVRKPRGF
ncbi:MAG TPA: hypothetical protein VEJ68_02930 [Candidatus Bathyarchaeia archaeon]|nr:hypothetical protein [Candidatus Bathyarchaeia archaeon]